MIRCCFCNRSAPCIDDAADAGWIPSFWVHDGSRQFLAQDVEVGGPVCHVCREVRLAWSEDHDDYVMPAIACP